MRYILSPLSKSGEGVGGGVTLYLITSVSAVSPKNTKKLLHRKAFMYQKYQKIKKITKILTRFLRSSL
ncbi:MAG: hypothetical protein ACKPFD_12560, partial [Dolichospermum sp.]